MLENKKANHAFQKRSFIISKADIQISQSHDNMLKRELKISFASILVDEIAS